jgi:hypothetical protein
MAELDKALGVTTDSTDILSRAGQAKTSTQARELLTEAGKQKVQALEQERVAATQKPIEEARIKGDYAQKEAELYKEADITRKKKLEEAPLPEFRPNEDTLVGMATLGSLIGLIGQTLGNTGGKQSALNSINAMSGMMAGYQQGKKDYMRVQQLEFEKNFNSMKAKQEQIQKEFEAAIKKMPYDLAKSREDMEVALAKAGSPFLTAVYQKRGAEATYKIIDDLGKSIQKAEEIANKANMAKDKSQMTKGGAANARYAFNIAESFGQAATDVLNITQVPKNTVLGMFADMAGKSGDSFTQSLKTTLSRKLTKADERAMQQVISGLEMNMSRALGGGYAQSGAKYMIDIYKQQVPKAGDPPIVTALFLARIKQELGVLAKAFSAHPGATEGYVQQMNDYMDAMNEVIPFNVGNVLSVLGRGRETISGQAQKIVNAQSKIPLPVAPSTSPTAPATAKIATQDDIVTTANANNISVEEAKSRLKAKGWTIEGEQ